MIKKKQKNVVLVGGSIGIFIVLTSLKNLPVHLSVIINMADSGGSAEI